MEDAFARLGSGALSSHEDIERRRFFFATTPALFAGELSLFRAGDTLALFNLCGGGGPVAQQGFLVLARGVVAVDGFVQKLSRDGLKLTNPHIDVIVVERRQIVVRIICIIRALDDNFRRHARLVPEVVDAMPALVDAIAKLRDEKFARALTGAGQTGRNDLFHERFVMFISHPSRDVTPLTTHRFGDEHARAIGVDDDATTSAPA